MGGGFLHLMVQMKVGSLESSQRLTFVVQNRFFSTEIIDHYRTEYNYTMKELSNASSQQRCQLTQSARTSPHTCVRAPAPCPREQLFEINLFCHRASDTGSRAANAVSTPIYLYGILM